jgi:hypothetical protein
VPSGRRAVSMGFQPVPGLNHSHVDAIIANRYACLAFRAAAALKR